MSSSIDVIIILAGSLNIGRKPGKTTKERLDSYLQIQKLHSSTPILVSGRGAILKKTATSFTLADSMKLYLTKHKVPSRLIFKEEESLDTITNAYFSKKIILKKLPKARHILLITSDTHMRRALWIFNRIFGPRFSFVTRSAAELDTKDLLQRRIKYEKWLLRETKKILAKVPAGNDRLITVSLKQFHPQLSQSQQAKDFYLRAKLKQETLMGSI
jgi:uncharacterized SAM-binding protein YcdF (DUF218 family)